MRILLINNFLSDTGGSEAYTYNTGQLLRKNGHNVFYFAADRQPYLMNEYEYSSYFPQCIDYKLLSKSELILNTIRPFYNFEAEDKLGKYLDDIQPDIVHCNCISFVLTPSVLNACYKRNIPVVMTMHGPQLMCPGVKMMHKSETYCKDELCISGSFIHCITNKCLGKSLIKSLGITTEFMFRKIHGLYNQVSMFISPSQALLELAARSGIPKTKLVLNNNFIDESKYKIEPNYENQGYFLFVGRLSQEKGVHYLLEAMSRLPKEIKLHIVGTGQEEGNLKKLANELKLTNVKFLGFKSGKDLDEEYKNCIATILPCNWFENFPTTIIESFIFGKPVIGSNIGGIPEMLRNDESGINGIITEPGNINELASAVKQLFENNNQVVEMGHSGRVKAESYYSPERHYSKLIDIYNSVV